MGQPERDEPTQIQRGGAVVQPVIVFGHAAVAKLAVAAHQPSDGTFDHRPMLSVFVLPLGVSCLGAGGSQQHIVRVDLEIFAVEASGAAVPQRAVAARGFELRPAGATDGADDPSRAGHGAFDVVDREIIDGKPAWHSRAHWRGFDHIDVAVLSQSGAEFP